MSEPPDKQPNLGPLLVVLSLPFLLGVVAFVLLLAWVLAARDPERERISRERREERARSAQLGLAAALVHAPDPGAASRMVLDSTLPADLDAAITEYVETYPDIAGVSREPDPYGLAPLRGLPGAVEWLERRRRAHPSERAWHRRLGLLHFENKRYSEAIAPLADELQLICREHGLKFDSEQRLVLDAADAGGGPTRLDDAWPTIDCLALCCWRSGRGEDALRHANMGLTMAQEHRRAEGRSAEWIQAGDRNIRVLRALIHLDREQPREAEAELRQALVGVGICSYLDPGPLLAEAGQRLETLRSRAPASSPHR